MSHREKHFLENFLSEPLCGLNAEPSSQQTVSIQKKGCDTGGLSPRFCTRPPPPAEVGKGPLGGPQMVRLQCPHLALAAPAPQLSSPSVQSANVRRSLSSRSVQQFIPRPCVRSLHSLPGLYRVMRASRSMVTPFPWCCCSWPHSATLGGGGGALEGGVQGGAMGGGGAVRRVGWAPPYVWPAAIDPW